MADRWQARTNHEHHTAPPELLLDGKIVALFMWDCHGPTPEAESEMVAAVEQRCEEVAKSLNELDRLRKALEDMPHTNECLSNGYWRYTVDGGYIPSDESRCNCPKSRALNSPRIEPSNG